MSLHIFDMDGTLLDSMNMWREIDIEYLARHGIEYNETQLHAIKHMTIKECAAYFIHTFQIEKTPETMIAEWLAMARESYEHTLPLKPKAYEYVHRLHLNNEKIMLATSCDRAFAIAAMKRHGLYDWLETIVTTNELGINKGNSLFYETIAMKQGIDPKDCIVYDDLASALKSAKAAGMQTVGVYDPCNEHEKELLSQTADRLIESFAELL